MREPAADAPASEWLVYGDALLQAGDARGELVALNVGVAEGRASPETRDQFVRRRWPRLDAASLAWRLGPLAELTIALGPGDVDPFAEMFATPDAPIARVSLVGEPTVVPVDLSLAMASLLEHAPASCVDFAFVDARARASRSLVSREWSPDPNLVRFGPLWLWFQRARRLAIETADALQLDLGTLDAAGLEAFVLRSLRLGPRNNETLVETLAMAKFEALRSFELRLVESWWANAPIAPEPYRDVYSGWDVVEQTPPLSYDWSRLASLFELLALNPLEHLALTSAHSTETLLPVLAELAWPELRVLDLSDGNVRDDQVVWIERIAARAPQLERVVLERTAASASAVARLRGGGLDVVHSTASWPPTHRYVVGQE